MKQERVILSFIMVLIGLLVAGVAFYLYQGTKTIPASNIKTVTVATPSPTPEASSIYLSLDNPADESVTQNKTVTISGKTTPNATIVVLTDSAQEVVTPTAEGSFTTTLTLSDGENLIRVIAFASDGESASAQRMVTYSTEQF